MRSRPPRPLVPPTSRALYRMRAKAIEHAHQALEHLDRADEQLGPRGEQLVYAPGEVKLHAPKPFGARIACAGSNYADHAARMAANWACPKLSGDKTGDITSVIEPMESGDSGRWEATPLGPTATPLLPIR